MSEISQNIDRSFVSTVLESKMVKRATRTVASLALVAKFLTPGMAAAEESPDEVYTTGLVAEINAARANQGLHSLGVSPRGREAEVPLQQYLNDLAEGRNGIVPPTDYFRDRINIGQMRGVLIGVPLIGEDYWANHSVVEQWERDPSTAQNLFDEVANGVVCAKAQVKPTYVGCVTFNGPIQP